jgi:uncharacterized membrane protein YdbT with pleckstrin-like domain
MSYIDRNLLSDEKIIFRTRKHLIIFLSPLLILLISCFASYYMRHNLVLKTFVWAPWVVALVVAAATGLEYYASEYAITNKRILMREGFFYRHTNEMRISAVSQVNVDQSLAGQFLGYGAIVINAMGAFDAFSYIDKPTVFQQYVNAELDKLVR